MKIIKTELGNKYKLLKDTIEETALYPWIAKRNNIKQAFKNNQVRIGLYIETVTEGDYFGTVSFSSGRGFVQIGCKRFENINAIKLRRWALSK